MWGLGLGLTGAIFVLAVFAQLVYGDTPATDSAFNVLGLAVSVRFGAKGNSLYARHLLSRGYTELPETVEAANPQAALAQYFGRGADKRVFFSIMPSENVQTAFLITFCLQHITNQSFLFRSEMHTMRPYPIFANKERKWHV